MAPAPDMSPDDTLRAAPAARLHTKETFRWPQPYIHHSAPQTVLLTRVVATGRAKGVSPDGRLSKFLRQVSIPHTHHHHLVDFAQDQTMSADETCGSSTEGRIVRFSKQHFTWVSGLFGLARVPAMSSDATLRGAAAAPVHSNYMFRLPQPHIQHSPPCRSANRGTASCWSTSGGKLISVEQCPHPRLREVAHLVVGPYKLTSPKLAATAPPLSTSRHKTAQATLRPPAARRLAVAPGRASLCAFSGASVPQQLEQQKLSSDILLLHTLR